MLVLKTQLPHPTQWYFQGFSGVTLMYASVNPIKLKKQTNINFYFYFKNGKTNVGGPTKQITKLLWPKDTYTL
jgi:hypothetical protein